MVMEDDKAFIAGQRRSGETYRSPVSSLGLLYQALYFLVKKDRSKLAVEEIMDLPTTTDKEEAVNYQQIYLTEKLFGEIVYAPLISWLRASKKHGDRFFVPGSGTGGVEDQIWEEYRGKVDITSSDISGRALKGMLDNDYIPYELRNHLETRQIVADATNLGNIKDDQFDWTVTWNLAHHLPDITSLSNMLFETARVAKKGVCHADPYDIDKKPLPPLAVYAMTTLSRMLHRFRKGKSFELGNLVRHDAVISYFRSYQEADIKKAVDDANKKLAEYALENNKSVKHLNLSPSKDGFFWVISGDWSKQL